MQINTGSKLRLPAPGWTPKGRTSTAAITGANNVQKKQPIDYRLTGGLPAPLPAPAWFPRTGPSIQTGPTQRMQFQSQAGNTVRLGPNTTYQTQRPKPAPLWQQRYQELMDILARRSTTSRPSNVSGVMG